MAKPLYVNKHTNLLLVGKGETNYAIGEIVYAESYEEVLNSYGESDLSRAFRIAKNFGVKYIFLMNLQKDNDYFSAIDSLRESDFAYVAFVTLMLSDTFQETYNGGLVHSTLAYILGNIGRNCSSTFLVTDKHASLYEDIDAYLDDMNRVQTRFLNSCSIRANLQNVIFVANNLKDYRMANVPLAATLCVTAINQYPTSQRFGEAIFYINAWDNIGDMAYFRSNLTRETTIENLVNLMRELSPEKVVFIDRIMKYIMREMDFQEFKGRQYTAYQKLLFSQKLQKYFESLVGFIIKSFKIDSVEAFRGVPGTVTMLARIRVVPVNCLEVCTLKKEVEVG